MDTSVLDTTTWVLLIRALITVLACQQLRVVSESNKTPTVATRASDS